MLNYFFQEEAERDDIALAAREILEKRIDESMAKYPRSLEANHIIEITGTSKDTVYKMLQQRKIPSAKKIMGAWRVPALTFFAWWYGGNQEVDN